jgi:hypothetical protein
MGRVSSKSKEHRQDCLCHKEWSEGLGGLPRAGETE